MGIRSDVSQLGPLEIVELFIWDDTNIGGNTVLRWHAGTNELDVSIYWQGERYSPFPTQADGFEESGTGSLPRPTITASNIGGYLGNYLRTMADGVGAKFTRKRTLGKYLDAINFPDGNPYADENGGFPDEIFYVARKVSENPISIQLELAVAFDVSNIMLPRRQVIAGTCQWIYRGAECSYAGPPVQDINGNPTTDPAQDRCRKTLDACKARFGTGILKTSAFPASLLNSYV